MKISVVTGVYNAEGFILRLYDSLCRQNFKDFEWIVVDDFSNDKTLDLICGLTPPGDGPIRVYQIPFNSGGPAANSCAILKASGDIVVKIDHDDELVDGALSRISDDWDEFSEDLEFSGILYKSVQPDSGKVMEVSLKRGVLFSWSKFMNSAKRSVDGLHAFDRQVVQSVTSKPDRKDICLNSVNLLRMSRSRPFVFGGGEVLSIYNRDNPNSQTNFVRVTDRTIYTYSLLLGFFDKYYFLNFGRWVRHSAYLCKLCLLRKKSPLRVLSDIKSWVGKVVYVSVIPLGFVSKLFSSASEFREVVDFKVSDLENLKPVKVIG